MDQPRFPGKHIYGGGFLARLDYAKSKHGSEGWDRLMSTMVERGYNGPKNPQEFKLKDKYPLDSLIIFYESYRDIFGQDAFFRMSRSAPKKKGIVGWFMRWAATPDIVLNKAGEYWGHFYDFGRLEGELTGKNSGMLTGHDTFTTPLFCQGLTHYYLGVFDSINVSNGTCMHTDCVGNGDRFCRWEVGW